MYGDPLKTIWEGPVDRNKSSWISVQVGSWLNCQFNEHFWALTKCVDRCLVYVNEQFTFPVCTKCNSGILYKMRRKRIVRIV